MKSLYSQYDRVTKCRMITHANLRGGNIPLPTIGDRYSRTWTRNVFVLLSISIKGFNHPYYWYNVSSYNEGSLCKSLLLEEYLCEINVDSLVENMFVVK